jgi:hypothetical protein
VDNFAFCNKLFDFSVTGNTQLSRLIQNLIGQIRTVRIMALNTIVLQWWMDMAGLSVQPDLFFVTSYAKFTSLSNK